MTRRRNSMRERNQTGRDQDRNAYKKKTPAIMKRRRWATKHYPLSLFLFGLFGYVSISRKGFMYSIYQESFKCLQEIEEKEDETNSLLFMISLI